MKERKKCSNECEEHFVFLVLHLEDGQLQVLKRNNPYQALATSIFFIQCY